MAFLLLHNYTDFILFITLKFFINDKKYVLRAATRII